ncbi:hypothetical protein LXL04_038817 [Taraxacum kok-saghyz]
MTLLHIARRDEFYADVSSDFLTNKNTTHLFINCPLSSLIWAKFGQWWNLPLPTPRTIEEFLVWSSNAQKKTCEDLWFQVAIIAVFSSVWKLRNEVIFDKKKVVIDLEFRKTQEMAYQWLSSRNPKFKWELHKWVYNPRNNILTSYSLLGGYFGKLDGSQGSGLLILDEWVRRNVPHFVVQKKQIHGYWVRLQVGNPKGTSVLPGIMGFPAKSSARMQPALHKSTPTPYSVAPSKSSGGRYHKESRAQNHQF